VQAWDRYAYVNNNPLRYNDPSGHWIESFLDIASIAYDIYDISQNGLNWGTGLALAADIGGLILPGVTGGGLAVRALTHADEAVDAYKTANNASNILQTINQTENVADSVAHMDDVSTTAGFLLCRYCSSAEVQAIQETKLLRGGRSGTTYFTTDIYSSASEAQRYLALPSRPNVRVEFTIINSPKINGPNIVSPKFGHQGGGIEYWSDDTVEVIVQKITQLMD
jgi:hypothetical protein